VKEPQILKKIVVNNIFKPKSSLLVSSFVSFSGKYLARNFVLISDHKRKLRDKV
jgi:hypothetical protein